MKRTAIILAGGLVGTLGLTSVAVAQEFSLYGRVVSGIIYDNPDGGDGVWDIGTVDSGNANDDVGGGDRLFSRIGVRGSYDLGNGMTSGAHVEKRLDGWRTRHQNVWLAGPLGRITLGQQSLPYYGAVTWDGANFTGGTFDPGSRGTGVSYTSDLGGPFNFAVMLRDDDSIARVASEDAVDEYQITGSFSTDLATVSLGYVDGDDDRPYQVGGAVGGSAGGLSWKLGYQKTEDLSNHYGFHLGYGIGNGNAYAQYEDFDTETNLGETSAVIVGYSYGIGPSTRIIGEHRHLDDIASRTILAMRVDF